MDLRLGLILFLGGLWVYLLDVIRDLTLNEPTHAALFFLGFVHFVVLAYLGLSLASLYSAGLADLGGVRQPIRWAAPIDRILFGTWPVVLVALVLSFAVTKLGFPDAWRAFVLVFFVVGLAYTLLYHAVFRTTPLGKVFVAWSPMLGLFAGLAIGYFVYLPIVAAFLADVEVTTDKEFYTAQDTIVVSAKPGGYVLRPTITRVSCGLFARSDPPESTLSIPPDEHFGESFIEVDFRPQAIPLKLREFHYLRILPRGESGGSERP